MGVGHGASIPPFTPSQVANRPNRNSEPPVFLRHLLLTFGTKGMRTCSALTDRHTARLQEASNRSGVEARTRVHSTLPVLCAPLLHREPLQNLATTTCVLLSTSTRSIEAQAEQPLPPSVTAMDPARFLRDQGGGGGAEEQSGSQLEDEDQVPCVLDIFVHEARGTHKNIHVYGDHQDVYARLALTSAPDDGASARLGERLPPLRLARGRLAVDVLKCELWTRGRASRGLPDDQLLGFALVPLASVAAADGARIVAADFELSSTDLLHPPAGAVRLSLALRPAGLPGGAGACEPSVASEVAVLGPAPMAVDCSRIEFTDLRVEQEKDAAAVQCLPFLNAGDGDGDGVAAEEDYCEICTSPRGEKSAASSDGSTSRNAAASTASTVSEDRAVSSSAEAAEQPPPPDVEEAATAPVSRRSPDTPTSRGGKAKADVDVLVPSPIGDIDVEAEQSAMQRQIMEMYVKSMQQFSESLAKMQLPVALSGSGGVQKEETPDDKKVIERQQAKKDGARVFYGSRAFF